MKKFCLTTMIAVFFLIFSYGLQAQTTQLKLDQMKLAQTLFTGNWQRIINKDSVEVAEIQQYDKAFAENIYLIVNGKKTLRSTMIYGFSAKEGKFKGFWLWPSGRYSTWIGSFTAENKFSSNNVQDFNPEKVLSRSEMVYDTPNSYTAIFYKPDGTKGREYKLTRVK
jgi:hypothetical protein